jgi:alkanesulfonate monooxygenase SsuD/methylene tetrahydromethanopterin reductase-like flavin-dependent oxidoreductase (luciferase family)
MGRPVLPHVQQVVGRVAMSFPTGEEPSKLNTRPLHMGIQLPTTDGFGVGYQDVRPIAVAAEEAGFDSVWVGDHFSFNAPVVEAFIAAASAAAVTERIGIGFGVLLAALRHPGWAAKQLSSLQISSGNRIQLGVGVGGEFKSEWDAVGVPLSERGARTDAFLDALPGLLTGQSVDLGPPWNVTIPPLQPHGTLPPLWIGGRGDAALRRVIRHKGGWMGVWMNKEQVVERISRLGKLADEQGQSAPKVGLAIMVHVAPNADDAHRAMKGFMEPIYQISYEKIRPYTVAGDEDEVVDHLADLVATGIDSIVIIPASRDLAEDLPSLARVVSGLRDATDNGIEALRREKAT